MQFRAALGGDRKLPKVQRLAPSCRGLCFIMSLSMPLQTFYPKRGHVLICDFTHGFVMPEMLKVRPVVVISHGDTHQRRLCTVVPLSTTDPNPVKDWHYLLESQPLESIGYQKVWAKADMLYTVSFSRLDKPHRNTARGRQYFTPRLNQVDLAGVIEAVQAYLRLT